MTRIRAAAATIALLVLMASPAAAAQGDLPGSRDPVELPRFPRSWIVAYQDDAEVRPRDFILSQVDRIRRDVRVEDQLTVEASVESVTYEVPGGVSVQQVVEHYAEALGDDVLFRCRGLDCGRSNDWANQVFEQAILYGPDRNQVYQAWQWQDRLVSLYAIERGNKRVYVHLRLLDPRSGSGVAPERLLVQRLTERGWATIEGAKPTAEGGFAEPAQRVLEGLAPTLERFGGQTLYVVCHLYGRDSPDTLIATSQRCAETGVKLIAAGADTASGGPLPQLEPFGAGSLLPRATPPTARLEIVLPAIVATPGE